MRLWINGAPAEVITFSTTITGSSGASRKMVSHFACRLDRRAQDQDFGIASHAAQCIDKAVSFFEPILQCGGMLAEKLVDEGANALATNYNTGGFESGERIAHGRAADRKMQRQLGFRGQHTIGAHEFAPIDMRRGVRG